MNIRDAKRHALMQAAIAIADAMTTNNISYPVAANRDECKRIETELNHIAARLMMRSQLLR